MLLAATDVEVPFSYYSTNSQVPLNTEIIANKKTKTLEDCARTGYFNVIPTERGAKVEMPLIVFAVLNGFKTLQICDPAALDPLNTEWGILELVTLASLQANIKWLQQTGKKSAQYV